MKDRSSQDKLASQNIVKNTNLAHSLAGTATDLERSIKSDNVSKGTKERSSKEELQDKRVLKPGNLVCFFYLFVLTYVFKHNQNRSSKQTK